MYFTELPNHRANGFNERLHFSKFGKENIVYDAESTRSSCERHVGCLSIKTVSHGEEWYSVGGRELAVRPGHYLILNDDQEYSCRINGPEKTKVVSVFFKKDFASEVYRDTLLTDERSLENPTESDVNVPEFFQTLYPSNTKIEETLQSLVLALNQEANYEREALDDSFTQLLQELIFLNHSEVLRSKTVTAIKRSTQLEIYRRLCIARDLLHSTFARKLNLSSLSQMACLSTPQLIRQFKAVFQTTPHQYLTRIRLSHAAHLLIHSDASVNDITLQCGFENTSAFCRSFRRQYGIQPTQYRTLKS